MYAMRTGILSSLKLHKQKVVLAKSFYVLKQIKKDENI